MPPNRPKRKAAEISVPDTGPERKRLLNVLAQRRYRQRKNGRLRELETQARNRDSQLSNDIPSSHDIDSIINEASSAFPLALPDLPADLFSPSLVLPSPPSSTEFDIYTPPFAPSLEPGLPSFPAAAAGTVSDHLQTHQSSTFTFPDDHTLQVPSLTLLNAAMKVALRLNIVDTIWDLSASSPFYMTGDLSSSSSTQLDLSLLPAHLQPTPSQRLIPHHPLLDLLPWPTTRDKLIQVFSLPAEMRPKTAQDPMGMVRLVYDMEDPSGEGMRVTGEDPLEAKGWEIGQVLFERWWWAFEVAVVEGSNSRRRGRGENGLTL